MFFPLLGIFPPSPFTQQKMDGTAVIPGDVISVPEGLTRENGLTLEIGVKCRSDGKLVATRCGRLVWEGATVSVQHEANDGSGNLSKFGRGAAATLVAPAQGAKVHWRVLRVTRQWASGEIVAVDGAWCSVAHSFKAIIRGEDVRPLKGTELPPALTTCFRPGDIVVAEVVSLTDTRQYQVSTAKPMFGVVAAVSQATGRSLVPIRGVRDRMKDEDTGGEEPRWVPLISIVVDK